MAIDPTLTSNTEIRILKIEEALSEIWRMLTFVMNQEQFNRLNIIRQTEMTKLSTRLDDAEESVSELNEKYNDLL